ncbi:hypothetical protein BKA83DRAFT_4339408 [Pisolithus microcarpus]|nr:hypothetical protein BKA83DRAFT_4339408 [Pisolithus microcarpus]
MPWTRAQTRAMMIERSCQQLPQSTVLLRMERNIQVFLEHAQHNPTIGRAVKSFHIILRVRLEKVAPLRDCLLHLCNIADLQLILPSLKPFRWGQLLHGVRFHQLDLLSINVLHTVVAEFLEYHPGIAFLSVDACGVIRGPCPLDGRKLPALCDVSAPTRCVMRLVLNNPISRVAALQFSKADLAPIRTLVASLLMSTANLTVLQLEVSPTDYMPLDALVRHIPALRALKLTEVTKPGLAAPASQRRCWKDVNAWGKKLLHLPHLGDFALRTCLPFTRIPRNTDQERAVIGFWGGCELPHPNLQRIVVWYLYGVPQERMVFWERRWSPAERYDWVKTCDMVHPDNSSFV